MATSVIKYTAPVKAKKATGHTNAYGLMADSNAGTALGVYITSPIQCVALGYSASGIRILQVTNNGAVYSMNWLADSDVEYNMIYT